MMRIAFVTGHMELGGSTNFMLFLAAALRRKGVPTEVFSFSADHPLASEFAEAGVTVHTTDEHRLIYEDRLQQIYARLCVFRPTAVFAVLGAVSFEMLRYLPEGVARIGIFHDRTGQPHNIGPRYRGSFDHLVVIAAYLREEMRRIDPQIPCTYLAHGIPLPNGVLPRRALDRSAPLRLLYYGRFENATKGVRLFPEIVAVLKYRQIPFCWTIHGYGPEEKFLKTSLAKDVRSGRVRFSSPIPYEQLPALIRQHDVYLLTSINEGGPLTLLESMALGLVPVCGDIPGLVQEVITPANGFRVSRAEADAYARALAMLHADRDLLEQMSCAARAAIVADFSADAMAGRYLAFLEAHKFSTADVHWPGTVRVKPILGGNPLIHWGPLRVARRFIKALRGSPHRPQPGGQ